MRALIVVPYVNASEILELKNRLGYSLPVVYWEDIGRIGSDLAYQTLWNMYPNRDIIILHADMLPLPEDTNNTWYYSLCDYANQFPEAGILGTTLLYPAKDNNNNYYVQHAGGQFINGEALHFGGGLELLSSRTAKELETDQGQYDKKIREVSWVTFGGVYLRRSVINSIGNFDPAYYWTYYRDVDYCITTRNAGWKIYQTPIKLLHYEGKDNKRIQSADATKLEKWRINYSIFTEKWSGSSLTSTINELVYEEE